MSYSIKDIEGIGEAITKTLHGADIQTTADLLEVAASKKGREKLAEKTGLSEKRILTWCNLADLMRIKGVSSQYGELLHAAGVDTVKELAQRNAANLAAKMTEVNEAKNLCKKPPAEKNVTDWVEQAGSLDRVITH